MPRKPLTRCTKCRRRHDGVGLCPACAREREKASDARRGTPAQRGYGDAHRKRFRKRVLRRDPFCVCSDRSHGHSGMCGQIASRADHFPLSRRELVEKGLDPNNPEHGRGLCASCDSKQTAQRQPGGWNRRTP